MSDTSGIDEAAIWAEQESAKNFALLPPHKQQEILDYRAGLEAADAARAAANE